MGGVYEAGGELEEATEILDFVIVGINRLVERGPGGLVGPTTPFGPAVSLHLPDQTLTVFGDEDGGYPIAGAEVVADDLDARREILGPEVEGDTGSGERGLNDLVGRLTAIGVGLG